MSKIIFFLIFKYCLFFNLESKSTLNMKRKILPIYSSDHCFYQFLNSFLALLLCKKNVLDIYNVVDFGFLFHCETLKL